MFEWSVRINSTASTVFDDVYAKFCNKGKSGWLLSSRTPSATPGRNGRAVASRTPSRAASARTNARRSPLPFSTCRTARAFGWCRDAATEITSISPRMVPAVRRMSDAPADDRTSPWVDGAVSSEVLWRFMCSGVLWGVADCSLITSTILYHRRCRFFTRDLRAAVWKLVHDAGRGAAPIMHHFLVRRVVDSRPSTTVQKSVDVIYETIHKRSYTWSQP